MTALGRLPDGWRLTAFDSLPSTNDEALRLAREGVSEGTVVWAKTQTAGRGRQGRDWSSLEGNLFCSIVVQQDMSEVGTLSLLCAVALSESVEALCPDIQPKCKWPNDIYIEDRKLAGILIEGDGKAAVIGVGVNITTAPDDLPATSLLVAGCETSAANVLAAFLRRLEAWLRLWRRSGSDVVQKAWMTRAYGLDCSMEVRYAKTSMQGIFKGLDNDGALLLETPDGHQERVVAGEVLFKGND